MRKHWKEDNDNHQGPREEEPYSEEPEASAENRESEAGDANAETPLSGEEMPHSDDTEYIRGEPVDDEDFSSGEAEAYRAVLAQKQALEEEREALLEERDSLKDQVLRTRAEFDNYRKRLAREAEQNKKMATEALVRDLLPILDNLELALEHGKENTEGLTEGVQMVQNQLYDALTRHGLETIESKGVAFDPNVHEALMQAPSDEVPEGHVLQTFQKGYRLSDRVIRPAKVIVSQGTAKDEAESQDASEGTEPQQAEELDETPGSNANMDDSAHGRGA
ncbi:MAG: nucleotide exchange factor GrpE [Candidatus Hydrogenedentota bacterium]